MPYLSIVYFGKITCVTQKIWNCRIRIIVTIKYSLRTQPRIFCLVHPGVRERRRVLSQPRHETDFSWNHNGPVTLQLTDPIIWPNYPVELVGICVHINTLNKESPTNRCHNSTNVQLYLIFVYIYMAWVLMDGMLYFATQITVTASPY